MWHKQLSLPITLTLVRLALSPLVLPFFLVYLLPYNNPFFNGFLCFQFLFFSITDFFDGYVARKYNQVTVLGAMLDPIADKFLLYSALVALVAAHKLYFFWAIIWIGREFLVMGLRQIALEQNFSVPVSWYGKSKTVAQIISLAIVIANPYQGIGLFSCYWNIAEFVLLSIATALSLLSIYDYGAFFMKKWNNES